MITPLKYRSITTKFILLILFLSLAVTIISTIFQIKLEYNRGKFDILSQIDQIEVVHLSAIAATIWDVDKEKLKLHLQGLLRIPNIEEVSYSNPNDKRDDVVIGKETSSEVFHKTLPINYFNQNKNETKNLGTLKIAVGFDPLRKQTVQMGKRILIIETIKIFLLGLLMFLIFQKLVTRHLCKISEFTKNLDNIECLKNKLVLDRGENISDELSLIVTATNGVTNRLYAYTTNLHKIIDDKTKNIKFIMDNIKQGIFTILPNNKIHQEYSKYLETILETNKIADQDVMDVLFKDSNLSPEVLSKLLSALVSSLGEEYINFEMHADSFVKELRKNTPSGNQKILQLEWMPIINNRHIVEKIMVIVRSLTEARRLEIEAQKKEKEMEIVGEILSNSTEEFNLFTMKIRQIISDSKDFLKNINQDKNTNFESKLNEAISQFTKFLIAVKGTVRDFNLFSLAAPLHDMEKEIDGLKNRLSSPNNHIDSKIFEESMLILLKHHKKIQGHIDEYIELNNKKLNRDSNDSLGESYSSKISGDKAPIEVEVNSETVVTTEFANDKDKVADTIKSSKVPVDLQEALTHLSLLRNIPVQNLIPIQRHTLQKIYQFLTLIGSDSLKNILANNFGMLATLSKQLDKIPPKVVIHDQGIYIKNKVQNSIQNIFYHFFRNSMDHGIETASERQSKGKEAFGQIEIDLIVQKHQFIIRYRDDGKGLDFDRIKKIAIERGLIPSNNELSSEEICNVIFTPGFSTSRTLSEISGRGIGMDASKKITQDLGGDIRVILADAPIKIPGFYPFEIIISLPKDSVIIKREI